MKAIRASLLALWIVPLVANCSSETPTAPRNARILASVVQPGDFTIDPVGILSGGGGTVTVSGTLTCPLGQPVSVNANVTQVLKGKLVVSANGYKQGECSGLTQTWTTTGYSYPVAMKSGPASVVASMSTRDSSYNYQNVTVTADLKLTK